MDRALLAILVFAAGIVIGALGWERYQLRQANTEWSEAVKRKDAATADALAAERRLATAQTKRAEAAKALEASVNASDLDSCSVPLDVQRLLDSAAAETRAN